MQERARGKNSVPEARIECRWLLTVQAWENLHETPFAGVSRRIGLLFVIELPRQTVLEQSSSQANA